MPLSRSSGSLLLAGALSASVLLSACGPRTTGAENPADNPLLTEFREDNVVQFVTDLQIEKDPALEDGAGAKAEAAKSEALQRGKEAKARKNKGLFGAMVAVKEEAEGTVLVEDGVLWTSVDFFVRPAPDLRVYLSGAIDPRDIPFPSTSDTDLGPLPSPAGAQGITIPADPDRVPVRSVVFRDALTQRIIGFAQVSRAVEE